MPELVGPPWVAREELRPSSGPSTELLVPRVEEGGVAREEEGSALTSPLEVKAGTLDCASLFPALVGLRLPPFALVLLVEELVRELLEADAESLPS